MYVTEKKKTNISTRSRWSVATVTVWSSFRGLVTDKNAQCFCSLWCDKRTSILDLVCWWVVQLIKLMPFLLLEKKYFNEYDILISVYFLSFQISATVILIKFYKKLLMLITAFILAKLKRHEASQSIMWFVTHYWFRSTNYFRAGHFVILSFIFHLFIL